MPVTSKVKIAPTSENEVYLELSFYERYTKGGRTYEKGTAYKFTKDQAITLLSEQDGARSIWRRYRPGDDEEVQVVKVTPKKKVEDATQEAVKPAASNEMETTANPPKAIEIGNEEEIADLLGDPANVEIG